jgi:NTE family protein
VISPIALILSSVDNEPMTEKFPPFFSRVSPEGEPADGIALCLSGGGFRAMLYHSGAILRLNELGLMSRLDRVSSVSGGSIAAAALALSWSRLRWTSDMLSIDPDSLRSEFIEPLRQLARTTIDLSSIGLGVLNPFRSISEEVVSAYDEHLFHGATLQALSDETHDSTPKVPRFIFTATNVKTGTLWRFSKPYMADYRVGIIDKPNVSLAVAVAASTAFPPFLSPLRMNLDGFDFRPGVPGHDVPKSLRAEAVLTDGGVYDNLGLEAVWKRYKTVLISDGGRPAEDDLQPADDWIRHSRRLIDLLHREIGALRVRQVSCAFRDNDDPHQGAYWGIGNDAAKYPAKGLDCPFEETWRIATIETRLATLSDDNQEQIMNWGYAACDMAIRSYLAGFQDALAPSQFPFPRTEFGR